MFQRMTLWLLLLPLMVAGPGCALFGKDDVLKPAELVDFEPTVKVKRVWSARVGSGQDKRYTRFVPAFDGDRVFVADHKGRVFALEQSSGKRLWRAKTRLPVSGAVGAGAGMVLLGTYDAEVVALSQDDGRELWRARASSEILAPPQTNGDVVVAPTIDGRVFAFDAQTGARRWSYDHALPTLTLRSNARPLITENQLFIGFDNGQLVCFDPENGVIRWVVRVGQPQGRSDLDRIVDVDATPILANPMIFSAAYQGSVTAISRGTGRVVWQQDASTYHDMAYANDQLYVVTDDSRVRAYGATSGVVVWENDQMLRRGLRGPATIGNYLAVVDDDDYMHVLSQNDGNFARRLKPKGDGFRSPLMTFGDLLYVFSDDGRLTTYRIQEQ